MLPGQNTFLLGGDAKGSPIVSKFVIIIASAMCNRYYRPTQLDIQAALSDGCCRVLAIVM